MQHLSENIWFFLKTSNTEKTKQIWTSSEKIIVSLHCFFFLVELLVNTFSYETFKLYYETFTLNFLWFNIITIIDRGEVLDSLLLASSLACLLSLKSSKQQHKMLTINIYAVSMATDIEWFVLFPHFARRTNKAMFYCASAPGKNIFFMEVFSAA